MDFVSGVGIPDNQLSILRRRHQMSPVGRPVHSIYLRQMSFQRPLGLHQLIFGYRLVRVLRNIADYQQNRMSASGIMHHPQTVVVRRNTTRPTTQATGGNGSTAATMTMMTMATDVHELDGTHVSYRPAHPSSS